MHNPMGKRIEGKRIDLGPAETLLQNYIVHHHLKVTQKRDVILRAFAAAEQHVTAEALHDRIKQMGGHVGLATVYRTLKLFCDCGLAEERQFGDGHARYEMVCNAHHHDHLICTQCNAIIEFENDAIEKMQEEVARAHHFTVRSHKLEMYGLCQTCAQEAKK